MKLRTLAMTGLFAFTLAATVPAIASHIGSGSGSNHTAARSYLGVDVSDVTDADFNLLHVKEARGAHITRVDHDGPAGKVGLQVHDVILRINGQSIEGEEQCRRILRETPAGHSITLSISRNGQSLDVSATLANRAEVEKRAWEEHFVVPQPQPNDTYMASPAPAESKDSQSRFGAASSFLGSHLTFSSPYTGLTLDVVGPQLADFFGCKDGKGLLIHTVDTNSPAAAAGLRAGDVVTRVNGRPMESTKDFDRILRDTRGKAIGITILREKREQTLTMTPGGKKRSSLNSSDEQVNCALLDHFTI